MKVYEVEFKGFEGRAKIRHTLVVGCGNNEQAAKEWMELDLPKGHRLHGYSRKLIVKERK